LFKAEQQAHILLERIRLELLIFEAVKFILLMPGTLLSTETTLMDVSVDCVIFGFDERKLKVLIIDQKQVAKNHPVSHLQSALPGDLVQPSESFDHAAQRVLKELTNLSGIYLKQFYAFGSPDRVRKQKDQEWLVALRPNPERRVVTIGYYSLVNMDDFKPKAASFAGKARWVDVYEIPSMAFDHNEIVDKALEMLRHELIADNIGFELLPEKFTLSQLQHLYEIVLDKKMDKRNFRKNVLKMEQLQPLDEKQTGVLHKPAQLYQYQRKSK
jgi:8-oxo-dGTP diphosphatase